mgnify:CR=1 FL=1
MGMVRTLRDLSNAYRISCIRPAKPGLAAGRGSAASPGRDTPPHGKEARRDERDERDERNGLVRMVRIN